MRLLEQFQRLADGLAKQPNPTLAEVAGLLCCTERNARLVLQRMQNEGWLHWRPGRGRGHRSCLQLLQEPDSLRLQHMQGLLAAGKLEAAFDGLPSSSREQLKQILPNYLGASPAGGLRIPFYRPLHALDPLFVTRRTEAHLVRQIGAGLTRYNREREAILPALAHHWECSPDGRQWLFCLRPGLRFHDGRPLRAEDAVQTLLRARDTVGPHQALFRNLLQVEADGLTLRLVLDRPDQLLLHRLAHQAAVVLPAGDWLRADFAQLPVAAGAFRLVRNNNYRATLVAFDGYYRERALLGEIDLWVIPAGSTVPDMDVRMGRTQPAPPHRQQLRQLEHGCDFVLLNPARSAFASPAARLAIGAWLREAVRVLAAAEGRPTAMAYLPRWQHWPSVLAQQPSLAGQLTIVTYELASHIALAELVASQCRRAGATVQLKVLPFPAFASQDWRESADILVAGEVLGDDQVFDLFSGLCGEALHNVWLGDAMRVQLAALTAEITASPEEAHRLALIEQGYAAVVQAGYLLPMRHTYQSVDYSPHLGGVQLARCGWMDLRKLWLRPATAQV